MTWTLIVILTYYHLAINFNSKEQCEAAAKKFRNIEIVICIERLAFDRPPTAFTSNIPSNQPQRVYQP